MKKAIYPALAALILVTSAFVTATSSVDYKIKDGFKIAFKSKDPSGIFTSLKGTVKFDEANLAASKLDLSVDVSSISTGNGMMNKKAQTDEWFGSAKYPTIKYTTSKIEKAGNDYLLTGTLTLKGVSKEKKIPMKVTKAGTEITLTGAFAVNRMDYKIGHKSDAVPDVMNITYSVPLAKK
jgi:polyisoprenoid-binding protein YceI